MGIAHSSFAKSRIEFWLDDTLATQTTARCQASGSGGSRSARLDTKCNASNLGGLGDFRLLDCAQVEFGAMMTFDGFAIRSTCSLARTRESRRVCILLVFIFIQIESSLDGRRELKFRGGDIEIVGKTGCEKSTHAETQGD